MEAKDTVINDELIENIATVAWASVEAPKGHRELLHLYQELNSRRAIAKAQAIISFEVGVKQHSAICELDYEAGIREVVGELTFYNEGITLAQLFATNQFQAKLKGWAV